MPESKLQSTAAPHFEGSWEPAVMTGSGANFTGRRLLIAGGGTGGHVYPGLAVAGEWTRDGGTAAFAGVPGNIEARLVPEAGYELLPVEVRGFTRGRSREARLKALEAAFKLLTLGPVRQAMGAIRQFKPDVVLGVGGYVSGPVLLAARLLKIPTMILQLDAHPGIANRLAGQFVSRIGVALPEAGEKFRRKHRVRVVGNPIRPEVVSATREEGLAAFELEADRQTILVFGGSLGSRAINEAAVGALQALGQMKTWSARHQVLHITGKANPIALRPETAAAMGLRYLSMEYCDRMPLALAAADLAVTRAGATTIAELTARGIAAVLIPWSGAADNHQEANARSLERRGAARVILDSDLTAGSLAGVLGDLLSDPAYLKGMAAASREIGVPDAARQVAVELGELAAG